MKRLFDEVINMKKDVEYKLRVQVINYMLELEKIYNTRFTLEYKYPYPNSIYPNGGWQIEYASTTVIFTSAETLEALRDILKMHIEMLKK